MESTPAEGAAPVTAGERIALIDALRGFALFGILLANFPSFLGLPMARPHHMPVLFAGVDPNHFNWFFNGLLDGKFYTIFSFLFGLGFALQLERLLQRRTDGMRVFRRRMAVLLAFGFIHLTLWDGDILTWYALLGFTLPLFRPLSDRVLLAIAAILVFATPFALHEFGEVFSAPVRALADRVSVAMGAPVETGGVKPDYIAFIGGGGWREFFAWIVPDPLYGLAARLENWRLTKVLGTMLVGMVAGRQVLRGTLLDNRRLLWGVLLGGLAIGLPAMVIYAQEPPHTQNSLASMIGTLPLGLAYAAAFALAWPRLGAVGRSLVPVGRMALTNYLTQTLVAIAIYYGIGLGLMGRMSVLANIALAVALFAIQVAISRWWLAHHAQGPVEALWRRLTYGGRAALH